MKIDELNKDSIIRTKSAAETLNVVSEIKKWQKNCPKCGRIQSYVQRRSLMDSIRYGWTCSICKDILRRERTIKKHLLDKFERTCPSCKKILTYSDLYQLNRAIQKNSKCKKCVFKGRPISEEQKEFLRKSRRGHNNHRYGKKVSLLTRLRMSESQKKVIRMPMSEETKQKLRLYRAEWVNKYAGGPQYNPDACRYFDELNKKTGWNLQHAENGGEYYIRELGYFLDAYDKDRNIVIEYDEPRHYTVIGELKKKDVKRQARITSLLGCKFFRYNELTKNLEPACEISVTKAGKVI